MENSTKSIRITKLVKLMSTARLIDKNCVLYTLAANNFKIRIKNIIKIKYF